MNYGYTAIDADGRAHRGRLAAENPVELATLLAAQGLELVQAHPTRFARDRALYLNRRERMHFCFQLEQICRAGIPLLEALEDIAASHAEPRLKSLTHHLVRRIGAGERLSQALAHYPAAFPPLMTRLIAVGEHSGQLTAILPAINESLRWEDELASQTSKALLYPGFVLLVVASVTLFLMIVMVPQLNTFITQMNAPVGLSSRLLFMVSAQLTAHWPELLCATCAGAICITLALTHSTARLHLMSLAERLPVLGKILSDIGLSRFSATFALLYGAGIPVIEALSKTRETMTSQRLRQALAEAEREIHSGCGIASAFAGTGLFPPLLSRMLRIGEQTGKLDDVLDNMAYLYQRDARETIARLQSLIEPLLTLILGVLLGWIMLAILGPIYDVIGQVRM